MTSRGKKRAISNVVGRVAIAGRHRCSPSSSSSSFGPMILIDDFRDRNSFIPSRKDSRNRLLSRRVTARWITIVSASIDRLSRFLETLWSPTKINLKPRFDESCFLQTTFDLIWLRLNLIALWTYIRARSRKTYLFIWRSYYVIK